MPFSHHSHSGQFCPGHAVDSLDTIVQTAIANKFKVFALTEHMPRHERDLYPEEIKAGWSLQMHYDNEASYFEEAQKMRNKYQAQIDILVGFESEWCGTHSLELVEHSLQTYAYDFFVGSIHHVRGVPIDYDHTMYDRIRNELGGSDQSLFAEYYEEQLTMLQTLRPPVVGHFDLIKLLSSEPDANWVEMTDVWSKIVRNLDFVVSYGGILEINTAAWRKGLKEPYPSSEICRAFLARGGRFCLSDDSHGVAHLATNYNKLLPFLARNGIVSISYLSRSPFPTGVSDPRFPKLSAQSVCMADIAYHPTLASTVTRDEQSKGTG